MNSGVLFFFPHVAVFKCVLAKILNAPVQLLYSQMTQQVTLQVKDQKNWIFIKVEINNFPE